jgi:hypothetical protein
MKADAAAGGRAMNAASWVDDGEKYALIALHIKFDDPLPLQEMTPHHWAFTNQRFELPALWRASLGTLRTREIENSNLFLLSKMQSRLPEIAYTETDGLKHHVGHFYAGLLLASPSAPVHGPIMLTGYRQHGEIAVGTQHDYEPAIQSMVLRYPPVTLAELQLAAKIASQIAAIEAEISGGTSYWRFFRVLHLYVHSRTIRDNMERLHQYCRCIDGLIVPDIAKTRKQ